jgi:hypothetical protein
MKAINKIMTNAEIYNYAFGLLNTFNKSEVELPAAVSFSILKNKNTLISLAEDIERYRTEVLNKYKAYFNENNVLTIPAENVNSANEELADLLAISQEVKIYTFSVENLDGVNISPAQMETILFMFEEM